MALYKRGNVYWTAFVEDGELFRKALNTTKLRDARKSERDMIDAARQGSLTAKTKGRKTLFAAVDEYLKYKRGRAKSTRTPELEAERLSIVKAHFKDVRLSAITGKAIEEYQRVRKEAGTAPRTINMDVAALRRVLKRCGRWRALEEHVTLLPESASMIGRALAGEEQKRLIDAAASKPEWAHIHCAAVLALNTTMRRVEVTHLRRGDVDLFNKTVTIRRSKSESSQRRIPLNVDALRALKQIRPRRQARFHLTGPLPVVRLPMESDGPDQVYGEMGYRLAGSSRASQIAGSPVPRPSAHGDYGTRRNGHSRQRAQVHRGAHHAADARPLLPHPHDREAAGA